MKKWIWPAVRRGAFAVALVGCIILLGFVLQPQNNADAQWPTTATFRDFYELERNTVDVLFLGSSHTVRSFSPMELYNNYGLTSYNLGSEEQSLPISYFWLEEALRTQQPKVVVLDTFFLFGYAGHHKQPLNAPEASIRKSIDPMKFSKVKMKAIHEICELDDSLDPLSYYFPIIRYHDRWALLDAQSLRRNNEPGLMGYSPKFNTVISDRVLEPFERTHDTKLEMLPIAKEYLVRMTQLCRENGIRLLLVKTPTPDQLLEKHNAVREFADEYGLDFIDFNESEVFYDGLDYWFETDNCDVEHTNHWGAVKVTNYLGDFFIYEYGLEERYDSHWEEMDSLYQERIASGEEAAMSEI